MLLMIDEAVRARIREVIDRARNNRLSIDDMLDIMNGARQHVGLDPDYNVLIAMGYRVAYSEEEHPHGMMKHLSISCNDELPQRAAAAMLMEEFGFKSSLSDVAAYVEPGTGNAINLLEPVDD
jgi:hypothetical protein